MNTRIIASLGACLLLLLLPLTLLAQNWDVVKSSPDYVYGEGVGATIAEADQRALADLTSNISVFVQSDFEMTTTNQQDGSRVSSGSYAASRMKTYSQATLTNTERIVLSPEPNARVRRWMKKTEVDKLFQLRLAKAQDMTASASDRWPSRISSAKASGTKTCGWPSCSFSRTTRRPTP